MSSIHSLKRKDYATRDRLNWFVSEQVEEEDNCRTLIDKFSLLSVTMAWVSTCLIRSLEAAHTTHRPLAE